MKLDLMSLIGEIDRESSVETTKLCVAIRLGGMPNKIGNDGKAASNEVTMIGLVNNNADREVLLNAQVRSTSKYTLFLANLSSAIVDDWDRVEKHHIEGISDDIERQKAYARLQAWLSDYEIPHKVLMDYLGDVFECEGEWVRNKKIDQRLAPPSPVPQSRRPPG